MYNVDAKAGKGIFVDVRDDQTGTININLKNVRVEGVANHGIHISDCNLADKCGSGSGGAGEGSSASINVVLDNVTILMLVMVNLMQMDLELMSVVMVTLTLQL